MRPYMQAYFQPFITLGMIAKIWTFVTICVNRSIAVLRSLLWAARLCAVSHVKWQMFYIILVSNLNVLPRLFEYKVSRTEDNTAYRYRALLGNFLETSILDATYLAIRLLITQMQLEHCISALLQLHLHPWANTWLQWIGQRLLQDERRNV